MLKFLPGQKKMFLLLFTASLSGSLHPPFLSAATNDWVRGEPSSLVGNQFNLFLNSRTTNAPPNLFHIPIPKHFFVYPEKKKAASFWPVLPLQYLPSTSKHDFCRPAFPLLFPRKVAGNFNSSTERLEVKEGVGVWKSRRRLKFICVCDQEHVFAVNRGGVLHLGVVCVNALANWIQVFGIFMAVKWSPAATWQLTSLNTSVLSKN